MTKIDDGGPAFPFPEWQFPRGVTGVNEQTGMSLRDWFAGQALMGLIASRSPTTPTFHPKHDAEYVYAVADAMLAERG